jgi:hypothetical protein
MTVTRGLGTALFIVFCYAIGRRLLRRDLYASAAVRLFLALALAKDFITGRHLPVEIGMLILLAAILVGHITSRAGEPVFSRLVDDPAEA